MEWLKDLGSGTREVWKGVGASVLLHLATAAVVLFTISAAPPARTPLVVDLTIGGPWESGDSFGPVPGRAPRRAAGADAPEPPAAVRAPLSPPAPAPAPAPEVRPAQPVEAVPVLPAPATPAQAGAARAPSAPASGGSGTPTDVAVPGTASSGATASRAFPGTGTGEAGEMRGKAAGRHLERDYAYIRDAIQQGIAYPAVARRMGWEGKVVVSFLVLSDGSVRDVRVVQGSGHPALDRGAVEAVRRVAPFPRPPAEAEIITPVVYRLD